LGTYACKNPRRPTGGGAVPSGLAAGLEEAVDAGSLALAGHLTRHTYVLAETGREHELEVSSRSGRNKILPLRQIQHRYPLALLLDFQSG
jgi:hypothetical protein